MLSKETIDQIRKEAESAVQLIGVGHWAKGCATAWEEAYIQGATAWAVWKEKAEVYEKALRELSNHASDEGVRKYATKALEQ